jgi:putative endonuclease
MKKNTLYPMRPLNKREIGKQAEQQACLFLQNKGFQLLEQNYHSRFGEIDLIMRDRDDIVFVEVRSRSCMEYGHPLESIDRRKQQKLINTAVLFLQKKGWLYKVTGRFDIITMQFLSGKWQLDWIKNAFSAE